MALNLGLESLQASSETSVNVLPSQEELLGFCLLYNAVYELERSTNELNNFKNIGELYKATKKYKSQECVDMLESFVGCSIEGFVKQANQYATMIKERETQDPDFRKTFKKKLNAWKNFHLKLLTEWHRIIDKEVKSGNGDLATPLTSKMNVKLDDPDVIKRFTEYLKKNQNFAGIRGTILGLQLAVKDLNAFKDAQDLKKYGETVARLEKILQQLAKPVVDLPWKVA